MIEASSSSILGSNSSNAHNAKKMEAALNEWLEKVEEQLNMIDDKVQEKASIYDI